MSKHPTKFDSIKFEDHSHLAKIVKRVPLSPFSPNIHDTGYAI